MDYLIHTSDGTELYHHGVLGMKWGVRRYQNPDGTLTPAGKKRYLQTNSSEHQIKKSIREARKVYAENARTNMVAYDSNIAKAYRNEQRAAKLAKKGDTYNSKQYLDKAATDRAKAAINLALSENATKKLQDLNDGNIKAGRDFITASRFMVIPTPLGIMAGKKTIVIDDIK